VASPVFVDQLNTVNGAWVQTLSVAPTAVGTQAPLTLTGADGEGSLSLSNFQHYVTFAGYNVPAGAPATNATSVTVGSIGNTIAFVDTTTTDDALTGGFGIVTSAVRWGTDVWVASSEGVDYVTFGADNPSPARFLSVPVAGELQIVGGVLNSTSTTAGGLWVSNVALPVNVTDGSGPWSAELTPLATHASTDGFVFIDTASSGVANLLYTASPAAGLQRWTWDSLTSAWALSTTLGSQGFDHVTAFVNTDATVTVIGTTTGGAAILEWVDDGVSASVQAYTLASSPNPGMLRYLGVSLIPQ
jgi:hypothetical protein